MPAIILVNDIRILNEAAVARGLAMPAAAISFLSGIGLRISGGDLYGFPRTEHSF